MKKCLICKVKDISDFRRVCDGCLEDEVNRFAEELQREQPAITSPRMLRNSMQFCAYFKNRK